jgi:hypothetical protein
LRPLSLRQTSRMLGSMRLTHCLFLLLTVVSVAFGNLTATTVMLAALMPTTAHAISVPGNEHTPPCADCGRHATVPAPCAASCLLPPADLAAAMPVLAMSTAAPVVLPVAALNGRVLAPDPHPPQAIL